MLRFTGNIDGLVAFNRAFNRIEEAIDDYRFIWPGVANEFYAIEAEQFQTEGAAGASGKWAPLKKAYAEYKEVHFPGEPILQREHSLIESMTSMEGGDSIFRMTKDSITMGSNTPYAIHHQRGGKKLPKREVISLTDRSKRRLQKAIQRPLVQLARRQGFEVSGDAIN